MIPGGESTTLLNLMRDEPWFEAPARASTTAGGVLAGTCAGAILLSREVRPAPAEPRPARRGRSSATPTAGRSTRSRRASTRPRSAGRSTRSSSAPRASGRSSPTSRCWPATPASRCSCGRAASWPHVPPGAHAVARAPPLPGERLPAGRCGLARHDPRCSAVERPRRAVDLANDFVLALNQAARIVTASRRDEVGRRAAGSRRAGSPLR